MKSIHHIIVAAMDSGMSEIESETLAKELLAETDPVAILGDRIATTDAELQRLTNYRKALQAIRDKWAINGAMTYSNIEDRADRLRIPETPDRDMVNERAIPNA